ncbi:winged helix-turn-helix domain-containing protein [Paenibacillus sp. sptzw28]|uniref:winged helix-turn-helix domain-containing protein n=1 Tax=Paenibacillus sp. sptzw28 TaxID=715179 RepID=UPI001C6E5ADB|nr:winged helix-turn-helix domain-containing protein [Paenibacillus sp. sptzw28]QYR24347.1 winged helix-turn-helix domain-containing protein [Paenibacillus sp. sptzw28]
MMPGGLSSQTESASPDSAAKEAGAAGNDAGSRGAGSSGGGGGGAAAGGARLTGANAGHEPLAGTGALDSTAGGGAAGSSANAGMPDSGSADGRTGKSSPDHGVTGVGGMGTGSPNGGAAGVYNDAGRGEMRCGPFRLSAAERRLWKVDEEIVLTPTEWTLVKLLMERAGEGLSRDEILNAVWGRHFIGDLKIVDVNIRRIRQKIEDEPSDPRCIETLWGYGYRWNRSYKR